MSDINDDIHWQEDIISYNKKHINCPVCIKKDGSCPINNYSDYGGIYDFIFPKAHEWNLYLDGCPQKKN